MSEKVIEDGMNCECGQPLPWHLWELDTALRHVCSCGRAYKNDWGKVTVTGIERNPFAEYDRAHPPRPKVVCLCGSTRFYKEFMQANYEETMKGHIVLSVGFFPHSQEEAHGQNIGITAEQKFMLDELHKRKIDLADEILVVCPGGYIGESTQSEIQYTQAQGKPVRHWEKT